MVPLSDKPVLDIIADWLFLKDVMKARPDLTTRHVDKVLVMKN